MVNGDGGHTRCWVYRERQGADWQVIESVQPPFIQSTGRRIGPIETYPLALEILSAMRAGPKVQPPDPDDEG